MKKSVLPTLSVLAAVGLGLLPILSSAQDSKQDPPKEPERTSKINFEKEIVPIIKSSCLGCHNKDSKTDNVWFPDKMTFEDAKKNPKLWTKTGRVVKRGKMPPKDHGTITDKERKLVVQWVDDIFPKPVTPPVPPVPPTPPTTGTTSGN